MIRRLCATHEIAWIEIPLREQRPFLVILPGRTDPRDAARRRRRAASAKPDEIGYYPIRPTGCAAPEPIKSISGTAKALSCRTAPNCSPTRRFSRASTTVRPRFRVPVSSRRDDCDDALLDRAWRHGFTRRTAASSSLRRARGLRRGGTRLARGFHQGLACAYAGRDDRARGALHNRPSHGRSVPWLRA